MPEGAHEGEGNVSFTAWELEDALKMDLQDGADSRQCLDRLAYWRLMGGALDIDESSISAAGNHAALSNWHQGTLQAHAQDAIEVFEWIGGLIYSIADGIGSYETTEIVADQSELCYELVARGSGSGSHKLNKNEGVRVAGATLYSWIRDLVIAMAPAESFSTVGRDPPVDTPESLKHGLFLICEQVRMVRPRKRNAVSASNLEYDAMRDQIAAMRSIITLKTFESAVTHLKEEGALMKLAESFVGHGAATDLYDLAFTPSTGGSINSVTKKAFAKSLFEAHLLTGEA